ncbi:MAG: alpha/beta fold hydrolase [Paracoccaceae bacterium]|nr:alpha/beta fold hydrolase [Paracoccaceae bacterium]
MLAADGEPSQNRLCCSQIRVKPHDWHVEETGDGPTLLLLHGAGGASHSWHSLMPLLANQYHLVAFDLPGHGETRLGNRHRSGLDTMAQDLASLCADQGWTPHAIIGHSAGAAVGLRLTGKLPETPKLIGINPALSPFRGLAGVMFPVMARMFAMTPFMTDVILRNLATPGRVTSLLKSTGSKVTEDRVAAYTLLFQNRDHVDGTLLMMAAWKLDGLLADLPKLDLPCLFLTGGNDKTVPPVIAVEAAARMPDAHVHSMEGYGHLLHEEAPEKVAKAIVDWLATTK